MTEKRKYEKPSTRVVVLKQRSALLVGSPAPTKAKFDDYEDGDFSW